MKKKIDLQAKLVTSKLPCYANFFLYQDNIECCIEKLRKFTSHASFILKVRQFRVFKQLGKKKKIQNENITSVALITFYKK